MKKCVYNTDLKWLNELAKNKSSLVNFWRKDKRKLNLQEGDQFLFKIRGTQFIAGKAEFVKMEILTISDAWNQFLIGNGCPNKETFINRTHEVLHIEGSNENQEINCLILRNPIILDETEYIFISEKIFPKNILASKFFKEEELNDIDNKLKYPENIQELYLTENDIIYDSLEKYEEGKIYLSKHLKRERNVKLIKNIKENKRWICEICTFDFNKEYRLPYIEAHHKTPLSLKNESSVTFNDIALLCPNCHRAIHKYMKKHPEKEYEELKDIMIKVRSGV